MLRKKGRSPSGSTGAASVRLLAVLSPVAVATALLLAAEPPSAGTGPDSGHLALSAVILVLILFAVLTLRDNRRLSNRASERETRARSAQRQLAELSSIFEVSSRVNALEEVEEAVRFIVHSTHECLDADRSSVYLKSGDLLVLRSSAGAESGASEDVEVPLGEGIPGWVASHRRPLLLTERRDLEAFEIPGGSEEDVDSTVCVPLRTQGEPLGVLRVSRFRSRGKPPFTEWHLNLLGIFADYAANQIQNLRMYRKVRTAHARLEKSYEELREVQGQLLHAEKMSAIGQLISEVSHELNNPLTTTVGYAQLLARVNTDPEIGEYLETIRSEGMRCQRIIRNLLDFARKNEGGERCAVDVNGLIEQTVSLRTYQMSIDGVRVELDLARDLPPCFADPSRLQQLFLNLLNNAEQAITADAGGGTIVFRTRHRPAERWIDVSVTDDGPGIPAGLAERVFEPFYTTKPRGQGTGLGLSVCRGIVGELGGRISAEPAPIRGARFRVELPAARRETPSGHPHEEDPAHVVRGKRILLVDDDDRVRGLMTRTLCLDEHEVLPVADGEAALTELESSGFDLVLSDMRMPGMSGIELYRKISERDEEMADRVVFFTGAAITDEYEDFFRRTGRKYLQKPFALDDVRRTIWTALQQV